MPDCPQDSILASLLLNYPSLVYKYHEHDSLLENKVEQELSEQEKQDAWAAYERDQQLSTGMYKFSSFVFLIYSKANINIFLQKVANCQIRMSE